MKTLVERLREQADLLGMAADEIDLLRPDAELCRRIIEELVRQNSGMTPGWLIDMAANIKVSEGENGK